MNRRVAAACSVGSEDASRHVDCRHGESVRSGQVFTALCSVLPGGDFRHPAPLDRAQLNFTFHMLARERGSTKFAECSTFSILPAFCPSTLLTPSPCPFRASFHTRSQQLNRRKLSTRTPSRVHLHVSPPRIHARTLQTRRSPQHFARSTHRP